MATLRLYLLYTPHTPRARSRATYFTPLEPGVHPPHTPHPRSGSPWGQHGGISHLARGESPGERSSSTCGAAPHPPSRAPHSHRALAAAKASTTPYLLTAAPTVDPEFRSTLIARRPRGSIPAQLSRARVRASRERRRRGRSRGQVARRGGARKMVSTLLSLHVRRLPDLGSSTLIVSRTVQLLRMRKVGTLIGFRESFS